MLDFIFCATFAYGLYILVTTVPLKEGLMVIAGVFCALQVVRHKRVDMTG
jgi:hypothetical protein